MLDDFYRGFAAGPLEIIILALVLLLFVLGLVLLYVRLSRREERERRERAAETFEHLAEEKRLTPSERQTLEVLARFLNAPEKKYMLMRNQSMYNACAESATEDELVSEREVAALRVKLGFVSRSMEAPPDSTAQLPVGSSVLILQEGRPSVRGQVLEPSTTAFRVGVEAEQMPFPRGSRVEVLYQNNSGMYTFRSAITTFEKQVLHLEHDEQPERVQRRRYYRRNVALPVYVRRAGSAAKPAESRFIDLGGGGASLENPQGRFRSGDGVELSFHPDSEEALNVQANVVRTSRRGSVLHVNFEHLRESTRDRIYRMLFNPEEGE
jgi:hypothetical protein